VNLNYEDKWVENSRVLSLYEKKIMQGMCSTGRELNVCMEAWRVVGKIFKKFWSKRRYYYSYHIFDH